MPDSADPFRHHPEVRHLIADPETSVFRSFHPRDFDAQAIAEGRPPDWRYSDDERNAACAEAVAPFLGQDLWVFAYGSLLWDPAFRFAEIRKAYAPGSARRFILWVEGARGTPQRPGVMAALDRGDACYGMIYRIEAARLEEEFEVLWRRERIAPGYRPETFPVETEIGPLTAFGFVADHAAATIRPDLTRDQQIEALALARGPIGPNLDYIVNLKERFDRMGITDPEVDDLCAAAFARAQAAGFDPA